MQAQDAGGVGLTKKQFNPRTTNPRDDYKQTHMLNIYYMSTVDTGDSSIEPNSGKTISVKGINPSQITGLAGNDYPYQVIPNCVGYAVGRFNEIVGDGTCNWLRNGYPVPMFDNTIQEHNYNYIRRGDSGHSNLAATPSVGALMVWQVDGGWGHCGIVEEVKSSTQVIISESATGVTSGGGFLPDYNYDFSLRYVNFVSSEIGWKLGDSLNGYGKYGSSYKYYGFVANPATSSLSKSDTLIETNPTLDPPINDYQGGNNGTGTTTGGPISNKNAQKIANNTESYKYIESDIKRSHLKTAQYTGELNRTKSTNLLSTPSYVESPFIIVKIGDYTFGSYQTNSKNQLLMKENVIYPNYMQSIQITKVNGTVNSYVITMVYPIKPGDDPNLLDKIFSNVGYGKIYISYGDWSSPSFIYDEEEAIITKLSSSVDFSGSKITYTILCTSQAIALAADYHSFSATKAKPSDVIKQMINSNKYGLTDVFYGMKNGLSINGSDLIASDDVSVQLEAKYMDVISYVNYLVSCMCSQEDDPENPIRHSSYYFTIYDKTSNVLDDSYQQYMNGPFFKVSKVSSKTNTLSMSNIYEVDIGYPSDNLVTNFRIINDNSWDLIYKYSEQINQNNYSYKIDDNGNLVTYYNPSLTMDGTGRSKENYKSWWTKMTQFPVKAELSIKGLIKPVMLMTYLRVNALFYGNRHISSGLYVITKQVDTISSSGYRTELSLTRVGGDDDYITKMETQNETMSVWYPGDVKQYEYEQPRTEHNSTMNPTLNGTGKRPNTNNVKITKHTGANGTRWK